MPGSIQQALTDPGPHTTESLAARLPGFSIDAIRDALEMLTAQGVLERVSAPDGVQHYRYVAPARYAQANLDVVRDPAPQFDRKTR